MKKYFLKIVLDNGIEILEPMDPDVFSGEEFGNYQDNFEYALQHGRNFTTEMRSYNPNHILYLELIEEEES